MQKPAEAKSCFVIMPISDNSNYPTGHFNRVYEHLIKPACLLAGFEPIRADEVVATNYIALDIVKKIISSDMAICDLSSQNPNVLYELGIRQAFDKPVTLIKDTSTKRIFDIQGFRDLVYDENLRIDNVQSNIDQLSEAIKDTYNSRTTEINSLIKLLGITPAEINSKTEILPDTEILLDAINSINNRIRTLEVKTLSSEIRKLPFPIDNITINDHIQVKSSNELKIGDIVFQERLGYGEVIDIEKPDTVDTKIVIRFLNEGIKKLLFRFSRLHKLKTDN